MSQTYKTTLDQNSLTQAAQDIQNNDEALRSGFAGSSAPSDPAPVAGQRWYDTDNFIPYIYDGSDWVEVLIADSSGDLTISGDLVSAGAQASTSAGFVIKNNGGTTIATFGAGGGSNATLPAMNATSLNLTGSPLAIASGGTGSTSASAARSALGLSAVATRDVVGGTGITVTDGDGVAGNPSIAVNSTQTFSSLTVSGNLTADGLLVEGDAEFEGALDTVEIDVSGNSRLGRVDEQRPAGITASSNRTLLESESGQVVYITNSSAQVTLPSSPAVNTYYEIVNMTAGTPFVVANSGQVYTPNGSNGYVCELLSQYSSVRLIYQATNTWVELNQNGSVSYSSP